MKLFNRISLLLISSLVFAACERDYDAPPLNEPKYDGPAANTTIEELRAMGATVGEDAPYTIGEEKVMKAVITANDESGNIFKKIYLQDETGAIEMEVDQNSVYNYYPVGQTVYIDLKGLSLSMYGDELQLGHPDGYLYRTPWEEFQAHVKKDSWANPENVTPLVIDDISKVNADVNGYKFKLVKFTGVTFQNGGKGTFAPEDDSGWGPGQTCGRRSLVGKRLCGSAWPCVAERLCPLWSLRRTTKAGRDTKKAAPKGRLCCAGSYRQAGKQPCRDSFFRIRRSGRPVRHRGRRSGQPDHPGCGR